MAIRVQKLENRDPDTNSYYIEAFADTKNEVTPDATFEGLPEGATIEMSSSLITANGEVAFMKSDGQWNWV